MRTNLKQVRPQLAVTASPDSPTKRRPKETQKKQHHKKKKQKSKDETFHRTGTDIFSSEDKGPVSLVSIFTSPAPYGNCLDGGGLWLEEPQINEDGEGE